MGMHGSFKVFALFWHNCCGSEQCALSLPSWAECCGYSSAAAVCGVLGTLFELRAEWLALADTVLLGA